MVCRVDDLLVCVCSIRRFVELLDELSPRNINLDCLNQLCEHLVLICPAFLVPWLRRRVVSWYRGVVDFVVSGMGCLMH